MKLILIIGFTLAAQLSFAQSAKQKAECIQKFSTMKDNNGLGRSVESAALVCAQNAYDIERVTEVLSCTRNLNKFIDLNQYRETDPELHNKIQVYSPIVLCSTSENLRSFARFYNSKVVDCLNVLGSTTFSAKVNVKGIVWSEEKTKIYPVLPYSKSGGLEFHLEIIRLARQKICDPDGSSSINNIFISNRFGVLEALDLNGTYKVRNSVKKQKISNEIAVELNKLPACIKSVSKNILYISEITNSPEMRKSVDEEDAVQLGLLASQACLTGGADRVKLKSKCIDDLLAQEKSFDVAAEACTVNAN